jgi:hypothetical protein
MDVNERRANVRVYVSKNVQECNYPRGAVVMVAGAGGGSFPNLYFLILNYKRIHFVV